MSPASRRHVAVARLRPGMQEEYLRLHADPPPAVLAQIRRSGLRDYTISLRDGLLVSVFEHGGGDLAVDLAAMAEDPATQAWWDLTDPCLEAPPGAAGRERWLPLGEVFRAP